MKVLSPRRTLVSMRQKDLLFAVSILAFLVALTVLASCIVE